MPDSTLNLTADAVQLQCRHIRPDGRRCGSPSLRTGHFCYHHDLTRRTGPRQPQVNTARATKSNTFSLPTPADLSERSGLQLAIGQILHKIANNEIDPRRAGLLLYGLQIASALLPKAEPAPAPHQIVDEVIQDPELGSVAPEAELTEPEEPLSSSARTILGWLREVEAGDDVDTPGHRPASGPAPTLEAGATRNRAQRRALLSSQRKRHSAANRAARHPSPAGPASATLVTDTDSKGCTDGPLRPPAV